jgi:hypothetical protein
VAQGFTILPHGAAIAVAARNQGRAMAHILQIRYSRVLVVPDLAALNVKTTDRPGATIAGVEIRNVYIHGRPGRACDQQLEWANSAVRWVRIYFRNGGTDRPFILKEYPVPSGSIARAAAGQGALRMELLIRGKYPTGNLQAVNPYNFAWPSGPASLCLHGEATNATEQISFDLRQNARMHGVRAISAMTGPSRRISQIGSYPTPDKNIFGVTASLLARKLVNQ